MADSIPWTQIVTAVVAIYAAFMSTATYFSNRSDKARKIDVSLSNGLLDLTYTASEWMLIITVANPGYKNVVLNVPYLILPDKKTLVFPRPEASVVFPHKLEEACNFMLWTDAKVLAETLASQGYSGEIKVMAEVADGSGKKYRSKKKFVINIELWLK